MSSSSNSNGFADDLDCLHFLLGLIESRDWDHFHKVALARPATWRAISEVLAGREEFNGMTLLHAVARYDPPVEILARMIELRPRTLEEVDCLGRTPLHVAAGSEARPQILKLLTQNYPQACDVQDEDGRTPLHLACDASCELFEEGCPPRGPPSMDTVKILLSGSLKAATVEDEDEMNAVEYALISGASLRVVNLLQRASQRVMRRTNISNDVSMRSSHQTEVARPRLSVH